MLFEDSAALLGLTAAFFGVFVTQRTGNPTFDGAASIVIGAILCGVAVLLAYESKGLLVGEGADPALVASIKKIIADDPGVARVLRVLTMHLGPTDVLLNLEVEFKPGLSGTELVATVERLEQCIRARHAEVRRIFIEASTLAGARRTAADELEARTRTHG